MSKSKYVFITLTEVSREVTHKESFRLFQLAISNNPQLNCGVFKVTEHGYGAINTCGNTTYQDLPSLLCNRHNLNKVVV